MCVFEFLFFFFKQKTAYELRISDWSSDVCSSDLLAAALAIMARDLGGPAIAGQLLTYPMLDHRTGTDACPYANPTTGEFIWTRASNRFGWRALQGDHRVDDARRGWFSPSLAGDLAGLPPAYIATGSLDLSFDDTPAYARRRAAEGVSVG